MERTNSSARVVSNENNSRCGDCGDANDAVRVRVRGRQENFPQASAPLLPMRRTRSTLSSSSVSTRSLLLPARRRSDVDGAPNVSFGLTRPYPSTSQDSSVSSPIETPRTTRVSPSSPFPSWSPFPKRMSPPGVPFLRAATHRASVKVPILLPSVEKAGLPLEISLHGLGKLYELDRTTPPRHRNRGRREVPRPPWGLPPSTWSTSCYTWEPAGANLLP
jgi:hypothetical protein